MSNLKIIDASSRKKQSEMHKNFFDRCADAIDNGYYLEAIFMEYAAIESRLEVLCGLLGFPCNKFIDDNIRKSIQISHRIHCVKSYFNNSLFEKSKLPKKYFDNLNSWINKRNGYIHGLYKNEIKYSWRMSGAKQFAMTGLKYCDLLYNEVGRLKSLNKSHPEKFVFDVKCSSSDCYQYAINTL